MKAAHRNDAGMVTIWTVVVVVACISTVGLVLDGGTVLRAHSSAFDLASGAGRAAAQQLDQDELARGLVAIDPIQAQAAASRYLAGHHAIGTVTVDGSDVTVTVHQTVRLQILRPASVTVTSTATVSAVEPRGP
jgi:hypothetical protein